MRHITRDQLYPLLDQVTLVEAQPEPQYDAEHLPGAINAPDQLDAATAARIAPDPAATVVVYCSGPGCGRSVATALQFSQLGYTDVRVYRGGKADWAAAGLPLHHTPAPAGHPAGQPSRHADLEEPT